MIWLLKTFKIKSCLSSDLAVHVWFLLGKIRDIVRLCQRCICFPILIFSGLAIIFYLQYFYLIAQKVHLLRYMQTIVCLSLCSTKRNLMAYIFDFAYELDMSSKRCLAPYCNLFHRVTHTMFCVSLTLTVDELVEKTIFDAYGHVEFSTIFLYNIFHFTECLSDLRCRLDCY